MTLTPVARTARPVIEGLRPTADAELLIQEDRSCTPGISRSPKYVSAQTDPEAYLVRLCLDLQVDAMLLAMGAAAASDQGVGEASPGRVPPWQRWVAEDVQMARTLAADVLDGGAALPPALGSDPHHTVPTAAVDDLIARFESMASLLAGLLGQGTTGGALPQGAGRTGARPRVQHALARCKQRLAELRASRLDDGQHVVLP